MSQYKIDPESQFAQLFKISEMVNAFSHYSFAQSKRKLLIIGISGVINICQTFYILHREQKEAYGEYDTGILGMRLFFHNHKCGEICNVLNISQISIENELTSDEKKLTDEMFNFLIKPSKAWSFRWLLENHTVQWVKEKNLRTINLHDPFSDK